MLTFKGTHGTSITCASKICTEGFLPTKIGRAGRGVYFWQYYEKPRSAIELAAGWFEYQLKNKVYESEVDPKCAIIYGKFDVKEEDILDCDDEVREEVAEILNILPSIKEEDIHSAYESIVNAIEKVRNKSVILVKTIVSPPKVSCRLRNVIGYPPIFVIRDEIERIVAALEVTK